MAWWQWLVLALAIDFALRVVVRGWSKVTADTDNSSAKKGFIIPGVLAEAKNQISPVRDVLAEHGRLYYCNWGRVFYSPSAITKRFAREIVWQTRVDNLTQPVIVGVSLGGRVALDVAKEIRRIAPDIRPGLVVLDGIGSGPKNLLSGGKILAPIARWARFIPFGLITILVFGAVVTIPLSLFVNQGPVDSQIELGLNKHKVKVKAKKDMSWYFTGAFLRQMAHLAKPALSSADCRISTAGVPRVHLEQRHASSAGRA